MALELSNYLNDPSYTLQAVTQCYGLLAPIIYHNIVLVPVVQVSVFPPPYTPNNGIFIRATQQCILEKKNQCISYKVQITSIMKFHELIEKHFNNLNDMSRRT